jgi:hypothetical protein
MAIAAAKKTKAWKMNLTWGTFMKDAVTAK